jgi:formiminoglutamase
MYKRTDKKIWSGRIDTVDGMSGYRWHQIIETVDLEREPLPVLSKVQKGFVIIGYCCDEGIRRNKGRTGAKAGPAAIRKACASLSWHHSSHQVGLYDGGNIFCNDGYPENAQNELQTCVTKILHAGYLPLVFGGGHDLAFGSFKGIQGHHTDKKIGIINLDAHFDLREYPQGGHSGSPFLQIADFCSTNDQCFSYMVLGIQKKSNTKKLFQKARELSVSYIEAKEMIHPPSKSVQKRINDFIERQDYIYLTLCMDVFDQAYAPAVSAPCACGVTPQLVSPLISTIASSGKLMLFDIAEVNPLFDRDDQTARLAAHLIFSLLEDFA